MRCSYSASRRTRSARSCAFRYSSSGQSQRWRRRFGTGSFAAGPGDGWFVGKIMVVLD